MILLLIALILTGGRRLSHLRALQHDPVVARFCGLSRLPTERSVARWLSRFEDEQVEALKGANHAVAADLVRGMNLRRLTLDIDGSVVSTGLKVEGVRRGYNPDRRKVPSYYPITAYEAQSGLLLKVQNRAGNVHDGKGALGFMDALLVQLKDTYPDHAPRVPHGWRLLPAGNLRTDGCGRRRVRDQGTVLEVAGPAVTHPYPAALAAR